MNAGWLSDDQVRAMGFKSVGKGVKISGGAIIIGANNIEIGDNVRIDVGARLLAGKGHLRLGSHIHIATGALLLCAGGINIGDFCAVGFDSKLISASDDFTGDYLIGPTFDDGFINVKLAPITMEPCSVLGSGCTVLPGVVMAEGSAAGASTLLRKSTDPWVVYVERDRPIQKRRKRAVELADQWTKKWAER